MALCLLVEAIVILTLVVIIGWNKGVGDWMESLQRPVVRKLEMSGINSPYAVLMQVKGGKIIGNMKGDEKIYPASMTKIMTVIVAIENLDDLDEEITLTQEMFAGLYEQDATQAGFQPGKLRQWFGVGMDLNREFAGRGHNQRTRLIDFAAFRCRMGK